MVWIVWVGDSKHKNPSYKCVNGNKIAVKPWKLTDLQENRTTNSPFKNLLVSSCIHVFKHLVGLSSIQTFLISAQWPKSRRYGTTKFIWWNTSPTSAPVHTPRHTFAKLVLKSRLSTVKMVSENGKKGPKKIKNLLQFKWQKLWLPYSQTKPCDFKSQNHQNRCVRVSIGITCFQRNYVGAS